MEQLDEELESGICTSELEEFPTTFSSWHAAVTFFRSYAKDRGFAVKLSNCRYEAPNNSNASTSTTGASRIERKQGGCRSTREKENYLLRASLVGTTVEYITSAKLSAPCPWRVRLLRIRDEGSGNSTIFVLHQKGEHSHAIRTVEIHPNCDMNVAQAVSDDHDVDSNVEVLAIILGHVSAN